jgi:hypothetical protein
MEIFEVSMGLDLFLCLDDDLVASLDGSGCTDETAELFCEVRENLERIFEKDTKRINCQKISNQTKQRNIKHVKSRVRRHLEENSWTNEDEKYWYNPEFSKRGLALYECLFIRYTHNENDTKTTIDKYYVSVINDANCGDEAIEIATQRVDRNTIIVNINETIDFFTMSIIEGD